jgi:hypothetical protein
MWTLPLLWEAVDRAYGNSKFDSEKRGGAMFVPPLIFIPVIYI